MGKSKTTAALPREVEIHSQALSVGFDVVGITTPDGIGDSGRKLHDFLDRGWQGDMDWLATKAHFREHPLNLWPKAKSVIVVGANYFISGDPLSLLGESDVGVISVYARGRDYHDVLKSKLKRLARWIAKEYDADVKVLVDTAPIMEKPLAAAAGLGWQGKHTNLVSRELGSWLFLGVILTTLDLTPSVEESDNCGSCQRCLDVCPTEAFVGPHLLDARRCISYLTIEHKGAIPTEFRRSMGNRIYGCDDCLAVCPWNKFAQPSKETAFLPRAELTAPRLVDLAQLDDAAFRRVFSGSPIKRTGRDRFVRNVLIALGNSQDERSLPAVFARLDDLSDLVRGAAVWALRQLLDEEKFREVRKARRPKELTLEVLMEWDGLVV
tara:strand:+ start:1287 stop:2429 length:1143 start_codon:yes stop_codon:yes gene_type:complete